jgi:tetratricopeptide (TPR) repeat protein
MKGLLSVMVALMACASFSRASDLFDVGLKEANRKDYSSAVKIFDSIIQHEPGNRSALINSGNCYFKLKEFGKAVHRYETTMKLYPSDQQVITYLEACYTAIGKQEHWSPPYSTLDILIYRIGGTVWFCSGMLFSILFSIGLFIRVRGTNSSMLSGLTVLIPSCILFVLSMWAANRFHHYLNDQHHAIVISRTAPLLLNEQGELSDLHLVQGSRVEVHTLKRDLVETTDENGHRVYVRKSDVRFF